MKNVDESRLIAHFRYLFVITVLSSFELLCFFVGFVRIADLCVSYRSVSWYLYCLVAIVLGGI